jgi:site-specific recombinase XerD
VNEKAKNRSDRHVKLNSKALWEIRELKARQMELRFPTDSPMFISKHDQPIKSPRKWFTTVVKAAKIEAVAWHTLRHTFASRLVMEGVNLEKVQELMGTPLAMTARYAPLSPGYVESELEPLVQQRRRDEQKAKKSQIPGASMRRAASSHIIEKNSKSS